MIERGAPGVDVPERLALGDTPGEFARVFRCDAGRLKGSAEGEVVPPSVPRGADEEQGDRRHFWVAGTEGLLADGQGTLSELSRKCQVPVPARDEGHLHQDVRDARMIGAHRPLGRLERAGEESSSRGKVSLSFKHPAEQQPHRDGSLVVVPEHTLPDPQPRLGGGSRRREVALLHQDRGLRVQAHRGLGMVGPENAPPHRQGSLNPLPRLLEVGCLIANHAEIIDGLRQEGMIGRQFRLADCESPLVGAPGRGKIGGPPEDRSQRGQAFGHCQRIAILGSLANGESAAADSASPRVVGEIDQHERQRVHPRGHLGVGGPQCPFADGNAPLARRTGRRRIPQEPLRGTEVDEACREPCRLCVTGRLADPNRPLGGIEQPRPWHPLAPGGLRHEVEDVSRGGGVDRGRLLPREHVER